MPDPFAHLYDRLPSRYAPGFTPVPYLYDRFADTTDLWCPVIYYPAGEIVAGQGKVGLVEPFPAGRADGTDGLDPVDEHNGAGVAVLRGDALPKPVDGDLEGDGDWTIPGRSPARLCAYDAWVTDQKHLMAAWCEAYAVASALNNGTVASMLLNAADVEPLLAASRRELIGDTQLAGLDRELFYLPPGGQPGDERPLTAGHADRLRQDLITPIPDGARLAGESWMHVSYELTPAGADIVAAIRAQYEGPRRCRLCGCTESQACPDGCGWATGDLCTTCIRGGGV